MGREIRMVPAGWEHPKNERGHFQPMFDSSYREAMDDWIAQDALWKEGKHPDQVKPWTDVTQFKHYAQWNGGPPDVDYYRPEWEAPADHFQVYETVSEGTPTSPVFVTREELAEWLVTQGYSLEAAKNFSQTGWAPSMVIAGGHIYQGIESAALPRPPVT